MVLKFGRILLKTVCWLLLLSIILVLIFDRFVQFRMDDKDLGAYFQARHIEHHIEYYQTRGRRVRYIRVGEDDSSKATILFIHGAPSSLSYWNGYLSDSSLLAKATLCAVDRPGYGYSGFGDPLPDIAAQAAIIRPILDSLHRSRHPVILVGASYGAPIACRLAMDYPKLVDGLVLVAPPLAPGQERIFWFTYLVESPVIHWVVPRMLASANREKIHHRQDLDDMLPLWPRIHIPVNYLQGSNDDLVFTSNAGFAQTHLINTPSLHIDMIPGRGHLIAFKERDRIVKAIRDMLDRTRDINDAPGKTAGSH